jgi:hypothetical protein
MLQFRVSVVTSDAGLIAYREVSGVSACELYVDGLMASTFFCAERFGRLRSYVRPGGAAHMSAGPDEVRRPGIPIRFASSSSCLTTGCFWSSVAAVSFIAFQCACQTSNCDLCNCSVDMLADMLAGRAASLRLRGYFGAEDFAGPHYRPDDPGELVGQRHRDAAGRLFRQKRAEPVGERAFALAHATQQ